MALRVGERLVGRGIWRLIALAVGLIGVGWLAMGAATAQADTFSNPASIALRDPNFAGNPNCSNPAVLCNATAGTYPSTINVSGLSGTISNVSLSLNNVSYSFSDDIDALLVGPTGENLIVLAAVGPNTGSTEAASNSTLTISDSGTLPTDTTPWGAGSTFKPVNFGSYGLGNAVNGFNEDYTGPAPAPPWGDPGQNGTNATLGNTFDGTSPNGTWSLYVITTSGGDGTGSIAGGWTLNITTASAASTTTTLASSNNPSFTSAPNNSVTLTAMVSSGGNPVGEGTVDFTDGGTTISGCGSEPVSNGQATCTTAFSTEGSHSLQALYSGTTNFAPSSDVLSQQVDDHTTVSGSSYCNTGAVALNNPAIPPGDASPYPSHVFVSGRPGNLTDVTVTLKGVSYSFSQDIDALLVGPGGQSLILAADAGPNSNGGVSNVTLTLDDAATSTLSQTGSWGAANASVTSRPFNYGGFNETWGPPAPAGPYGNPGPSGGGTATLGSTFDGTSPNGTWSLYVITTASDGTGSIAGGWCVNTTIQMAALTIGTQASPASTTVGSPTSDTATLSGVPQGADAPTGTVTFNAYGPNDPTCSQTPAFTSVIPLTGAGTSASSGAFTPTSSGTYRWTASYSGDPNYSPQAANCNDPNETVAVSQVAPSLSTTTSGPVSVGGAISDTATLSGGQNPTGTITFDLFGPTDPRCSKPPAFSATVPVSGNGTYDSGPFTSTEAGTYRFVATYSGDTINSKVASTCSDTGESVVVSQVAPSLSTTASTSVTVGGAISDTAILSGGDSPSGAIEFELFGPNTATCAGTPIFTSTVNTVNGNGSYESDPFTATRAGTYEWIATYNGDANNHSATTACGALHESVAVTPAATQTTLASSRNPSLPGQPVTFTAMIAGAQPTGTVTFKDGADTLGTGPVGPSAAATLTTARLSAGSHPVTAVYGGDANNHGSTSNTITQVVTRPKPSAPRPPSALITSPTSGAHYRYGQAVQARYTCSEGANGPGLQSCTGTVASGSPLDTRTPGTHIFAVTATSMDGKTGTATVVYSVLPSNRIAVSRIVTHRDGTITFKACVPGPGALNVLETAWLDNYAHRTTGDVHAPRLLQPARGRFVFARVHVTALRAGTISVAVKPNSAGRKLLAHHRYPPVIRLWVSFTPTGGTRRDYGFYGLHLPRHRSSTHRCARKTYGGETPNC